MCNPVNTGDLYSTLNFSTREDLFMCVLHVVIIATIGLGTPWLFGGLSFLKNTLSMKDQKKIGSLNLAWKHIRRKTFLGHPYHYGHRLTTHFSHLQMLALGINS